MIDQLVLIAEGEDLHFVPLITNEQRADTIKDVRSRGQDPTIATWRVYKHDDTYLHVAMSWPWGGRMYFDCGEKQC